MANPKSSSTAVNQAQRRRSSSSERAYPDTTNPGTLTYDIISRTGSHGTITQFNPTTGTLVYTPHGGFRGGDTVPVQRDRDWLRDLGTHSANQSAGDRVTSSMVTADGHRRVH